MSSLFSSKPKGNLRRIGSSMAGRSREQLSLIFGTNTDKKTNVPKKQKSKLSISLQSENSPSTTAPSSPATTITRPALTQDDGLHVNEESQSSGTLRTIHEVKGGLRVDSPSLHHPPSKQICVELPGSFSFEDSGTKSSTHGPLSEKKEVSSANSSPPTLTSNFVNIFGKPLRRNSRNSDRVGDGKDGTNSKRNSRTEAKEDTHLSERKEVKSPQQLDSNELKTDDAWSCFGRRRSYGDVDPTWDDTKRRFTLVVRDTEGAVKECQGLRLTIGDKDSGSLQPYDSRMLVRRNSASGIQNIYDLNNQEVQHALPDEHIQGPRVRRPPSYFRVGSSSPNFRLIELEYRNATLEGKLRQYRDEIKLFKKDVKGYKKDEKRYMRELQEKDAEIYALNEKISQLVGQLASRPSHMASTTALRDVERPLPSPSLLPPQPPRSKRRTRVAPRRDESSTPVLRKRQTAL